MKLTLVELRQRLLRNNDLVAVLKDEATAQRLIRDTPLLHREGCVVGQKEALYRRVLQKQVEHAEATLRQIKLLKEKAA